MRINFTANGSTTGREDWIKGLTDFAASDIPFQTNPNDGSAPESPVAGSYAYMPITAGGTVFMYNLKIDGQQVTNLRLSGEKIAKIFTDVNHQLGRSRNSRRQSGSEAPRPDHRSGGPLRRRRFERLPVAVDDQSVPLTVELLLLERRDVHPPAARRRSIRRSPDPR